MDPKELVHWIPTPILALGFWWLLKRTFKDFEEKIGTLFKGLEEGIAKTHDHERRISILEDRAKRRR